VHLFVSYDTVAFHHCVLGKSWLWLFCWALPRSGWRSAYLAGGSAFRPRFVFCCCLFLCYDLPTYMTTGVHFDVSLTCFFSCKDRASERYRGEKKVVIHHCVLAANFCLCFWLLGSGPFSCWFAVSFGETQIWLGNLRVVLVGSLCDGFDEAALHVTNCVHMMTFLRTVESSSFHLLHSCKDRASERRRPYQRKKKLLC